MGRKHSNRAYGFEIKEAAVKNAIRVFREIAEQINGRKVVMIFDYDGTLSEIRKSPEEAVMQPDTQALLYNFTKMCGYKIIILSGRARNNVKKMVGLNGITYIGNHGFDALGDIRVPALSRAYMKLLSAILRDLKKNLKHINGIRIEAKKYSVSFHYRNVARGSENKAADAFRNITGPYVKAKKINILKGKKVLEVMPPIKWGKGETVKQIVKSNRGAENPAFMYFGDDVTDENAFQALKGKGFSFFVGNSARTKADYFLRSPKEVNKFLRKLLYYVRCE